MAEYMRVVTSISKWSKYSSGGTIDSNKLDADTITDLKTSKNRLSIWRYENKIEKIGAILAMFSKNKTIDSICAISMDEALLKEFAIVDKKANSLFEQFDHLHRDITQLQNQRLSELALILIGEINKKHFEVIKKDDIVDYYAREVLAGTVELNQFKLEVAKDIAKNLHTKITTGEIKIDEINEGIKTDIEKFFDKKTDCLAEHGCQRLLEYFA